MLPCVTASSGHRILALTPDDGPALHDLLERCDDYSRMNFGIPKGSADAQSQFLEGLQHVPEEIAVATGQTRTRVLWAADLPLRVQGGSHP